MLGRKINWVKLINWINSSSSFDLSSISSKSSIQIFYIISLQKKYFVIKIKIVWKISETYPVYVKRWFGKKNAKSIHEQRHRHNSTLTMRGRDTHTNNNTCVKRTRTRDLLSVFISSSARVSFPRARNVLLRLQSGILAREFAGSAGGGISRRSIIEIFRDNRQTTHGVGALWTPTTWESRGNGVQHEHHARIMMEQKEHTRERSVHESIGYVHHAHTHTHTYTHTRTQWWWRANVALLLLSVHPTGPPKYWRFRCGIVGHEKVTSEWYLRDPREQPRIFLSVGTFFCRRTSLIISSFITIILQLLFFKVYL